MQIKKISNKKKDLRCLTNHKIPTSNLLMFLLIRKQFYLITKTSKVVKEYPPLDRCPQNYPSAGSSVMLALEGDYSTAVIVICGGA